MDAHSAYKKNRRSRDVVRVIVELPTRLVEELDDWGATSGMTSRREATETLLKKGLEADAHASG